MFLHIKAVFACLAGVVAAVATWLLVDASGLAAADFLYHGDTLVGGQSAGYAIYQFTFAVLLGFMISAADGVFRETGAQRRAGYAIGIGCGLAGGLLGPGIGVGCASLFPPGQASPDGVSDVYLLDVFLISIGWAIAGAAAGAVPGIARKSLWIAQRGALGGAIGTLAGAVLFQLTTSIFDQSAAVGSASRLGSLAVAASMSALGSTLLPGLSRPVWLRLIRGKGRHGEYIVGRTPFRIGKDPGCDIVLPDSPAIAPVHIIIESIPQTNRHRLRHAARPPGGNHIYALTRLNEETMTSEKWLTDGDMICIADLAFEFHETVSQAQPAAPAQDSRRPPDSPPTFGWPASNQTTAIPRSMLPAAEAAGISAEVSLPAVGAPIPEAAPIYTDFRSEAGTKTAQDGGPSGQPLPSAPSRPRAQEEGNTREPSRKAIGTRLACIGGPYLGQSFPLTHQTAIIGRALDHSIALPADSTVSRNHARIFYDGGRHIITDFDSHNGLTVNDEAVIGPLPLSIGDIIQAGSTILRYE